MITLSFMFWATLVGALAGFWWQSDKVKNFALQHVYRHCKSQNLQMLDQTMVLIGVWPIRDEEGSLTLRRRYEFEFTSTGQARSKGVISLLGYRLQSLELEAHIIPEEDSEF